MTSFVLDTAALAIHLRCSPSYVRLLVSAGIITPIGTKMVRRTGRPSLTFDVDAVDEQIEEARLAGRVQFDQGRPRLRKSYVA